MFQIHASHFLLTLCLVTPENREKKRKELGKGNDREREEKMFLSYMFANRKGKRKEKINGNTRIIFYYFYTLMK